MFDFIKTSTLTNGLESVGTAISDGFGYAGTLADEGYESAKLGVGGEVM